MTDDPAALAAMLEEAAQHNAAGDPAATAERLRLLLRSQPDQPYLLHGLALTTGQLGEWEMACDLAKQAVAREPKIALFHLTLSDILRVLGRFEAADQEAQLAVALEPGNAQAWRVAAACRYDICRPAEAVIHAERAVHLQPELADAHFALAQALLVQGAFARGWEEYEWRFRVAGVPPPMPPTTRPQWDGSRLGGTLLLVADQGYGDVVQFGRFIPWAVARCAAVVIACSAETRSLIAQFAPDVPSFSDWKDQRDYEAYCPLSGLPRLYGVTLDNLPAATPYLWADPDLAKEWQARLAAVCPPHLRRIGIAWSGRKSHNNDRNRSARLDDLAPLAACKGIILVALQIGSGSDEIAAYRGHAPLLNAGMAIETFDDTMAVITQLDLVVTVDTALAHIAGAMGGPVWVMLPYAPDWRWLLDRKLTPWYPSMRLFRQSAPRQWGTVTAAIADAVIEWEGQSCGRHRAG
jgi:tetratricopeptide (TPR) repeat protein